MKKNISTKIELGEALKELREDKGITHYAAAKLYSNAKITPKRVKLFETAEKSMNVETLINYLNDMGARLVIEWKYEKNGESICE